MLDRKQGVLVVALYVACVLPVALALKDLSPEHEQLLKDLGAEARRLQLPNEVLERGIVHDDLDPRMAAFMRKLLKPAPNLRVVTLGGSITAGYQPAMQPRTSFPDELFNVLRKHFPKTWFTVTNFGSGGSNAGFSALCQASRIPSDVDIFLVEYSVNAYTGVCSCADGPFVAGLEALLRRLMREYPTLPIVMFSTFLWVVNFPDDMRPPVKLVPYFYTGENLHATLASYYKLPMISVRDALYLAVDEGSLPLRLTDFMLDRVHPNAEGCKLYAALIMHYFIRKLSEVMREAVPERSLDELRLYKPPAPMIVDAPLVGPCVPSWDVKNIPFTAVIGFHEYNPPHLGYAADAPGATLVWQFNSVVKGAAPGLGTTVAVFFYRSWRGGMGSTWFECLAGCTCSGTLFESYSKLRTTELTSGKVLVTPHEQCTVKLSITNATKTGGHRFRFEGYSVYVQPPENLVDILP